MAQTRGCNLIEISYSLPLISVITVCFNGAEFIEQTIQSVVTQTYPNIEYIIIDGGSTDNTVEIIQKYQAHLAYWHSKPDRGLAHAFNLGWAQAQGDWIIYLHADDFFLDPTVIEKMVPHLMEHREADVVIGQLIRMMRQKNPQPLPLIRREATPWRWQQFRRVCTFPHQAAFTNKKYYERVGRFDESFKIALDYEFYLRAGEHLRCPYIPIEVSGMRDGGIGARNIIKTFREAQLAQQKNKALSIGMSWLNLYFLIMCWIWHVVGHTIVDPFAQRISGCYDTLDKSIYHILLDKFISDVRSVLRIQKLHGV